MLNPQFMKAPTKDYELLPEAHFGCFLGICWDGPAQSTGLSILKQRRYSLNPKPNLPTQAVSSHAQAVFAKSTWPQASNRGSKIAISKYVSAGHILCSVV